MHIVSLMKPSLVENSVGRLAGENDVISRLAAIDRAFSDSVHLTASFVQRCLLRSLADAQHALTIASRMLARSAIASNDAVVAVMGHVRVHVLLFRVTEYISSRLPYSVPPSARFPH